MALFDNVTFTHYHDDLGRTKVPDAATFNEYKLDVVLWVQSLVDDKLIQEKHDGGIDDACCLMIESDYESAQTEAGGGNAGGAYSSETIGGYSYSKSTKAAEIAAEKNTKSAAEMRNVWLERYCYVLNGRR